jgi:hypothetical protein
MIVSEIYIFAHLDFILILIAHSLVCVCVFYNNFVFYITKICCHLL